MEFHYEISPSIVARKIAGELLFVPIKSNLGDMSCLYTANETGTRIWDSLVQKRPWPEIVEQFAQEYEVEKDKLEEDIKNFIEQLVSIGCLIPK